MSWGALTHGAGYDSANQTAYLDQMLRWGLDWSMRVRIPVLAHPVFSLLTHIRQAHPQSDVLYVQVGNATLDNSYWGGDQNIPTPRPSYAINASRYVALALYHVPGPTSSRCTTVQEQT